MSLLLLLNRAVAASVQAASSTAVVAAQVFTGASAPTQAPSAVQVQVAERFSASSATTRPIGAVSVTAFERFSISVAPVRGNGSTAITAAERFDATSAVTRGTGAFSASLVQTQGYVASGTLTGPAPVIYAQAGQTMRAALALIQPVGVLQATAVYRLPPLPNAALTKYGQQRVRRLSATVTRTLYGLPRKRSL